MVIIREEGRDYTAQLKKKKGDDYKIKKKLFKILKLRGTYTIEETVLGILFDNFSLPLGI